MPKYLVEITDADEPEPMGCGGWVVGFLAFLGVGFAFAFGGVAGLVGSLVLIFAVPLLIKLVFKLIKLVFKK